MDSLAPTIAFGAAGYCVAAALSAYTIFVLGIFDPKFGAAGAINLDLKVLLVVWSFHCATFLLAASSVHLSTVYLRLLDPSWTPERAVATNPQVGRRVLIGFLLGATFSLAMALFQPAAPWDRVLVGALGGACFCLATVRTRAGS
jgi:hypothetical protein